MSIDPEMLRRMVGMQSIDLAVEGRVVKENVIRQCNFDFASFEAPDGSKAVTLLFDVPMEAVKQLSGPIVDASAIRPQVIHFERTSVIFGIEPMRRFVQQLLAFLDQAEAGDNGTQGSPGA